ncbi:TIGR03086 family metal-binding protein [Virgisporangium aurantiacum]|uniref:TIGR03086 family protein n=1 Tax=Virgisporangium aurantiacum TaxID=175570 RepID=A0A8J3Z9F6_9ACTN|nr:TIGR03086 family metal-binding protein [Virgisporangium aurantiacum]GIJ58788.1 TIGR03086 family protein [Virgisporangium aurantiacum]
MQESSLIALAVPPTLAVVRAIPADRLDAPTPCGDWTVQDLVDHQLQWGPALVAAARKELLTPDPVSKGAPVDLERHFAALTAAWSEPAAWTGVTRLGGPMELPAAMIGGMVLGEVVVHGWDLAVATGQRPEWPAEVLECTHEEVAKTAEQGRAMHVYGPAVAVPDDAPLLDRILGLTGRDPKWRP